MAASFINNAIFIDQVTEDDVGKICRKKYDALYRITHIILFYYPHNTFCDLGQLFELMRNMYMVIHVRVLMSVASLYFLPL